jgi:hypothetical protein
MTVLRQRRRRAPVPRRSKQRLVHRRSWRSDCRLRSARMEALPSTPRRPRAQPRGARGQERLHSLAPEPLAGRGAKEVSGMSLIGGSTMSVGGSVSDVWACTLGACDRASWAVRLRCDKGCRESRCRPVAPPAVPAPRSSPSTRFAVLGNHLHLLVEAAGPGRPVARHDRPTPAGSCGSSGCRVPPPRSPPTGGRRAPGARRPTRTVAFVVDGRFEAPSAARASCGAAWVHASGAAPQATWSSR